MDAGTATNVYTQNNTTAPIELQVLYIAKKLCQRNQTSNDF